MKRRTIIIGLVSIFLLLLTAGVSAQEEKPANLSEAQQMLYEAGFGVPKNPVEAPDFTLESLQGKEVSLRELRGKVVVLNLWATWCPPCRAEMPSMQEVYDELADSGFTILAVAAPNSPRDSLEKIRDHIEKNDFTFPVLLDNDMTVNRSYGTGSIPTSWIIGPDGMLQARLVGAREWTDDTIVTALKLMMEG